MQRVLCFLSLYILAIPLAAQPAISIPDGKKFSLGEMNRGAVMEHTLTVANTGTDTLIIQRVDVSCGCTGSMLSQDRIPPHGKGTLKITFNSKNFTGAIHKSLTICSNAADDPRCLIEFDGTVIQEITCSPEFLWYQDASVGSTTERSLTIRNEGKHAFKLLGYSTGLDGLSAILPTQDIKPGDTVEVRVSYHPTQQQSLLSNQLTLQTSHRQQSEIKVGVYGNVVPAK